MSTKITPGHRQRYRLAGHGRRERADGGQCWYWIDLGSRGGVQNTRWVDEPPVQNVQLSGCVIRAAVRHKCEACLTPPNEIRGLADRIWDDDRVQQLELRLIKSLYLKRQGAVRFDYLEQCVEELQARIHNRERPGKESSVGSAISVIADRDSIRRIEYLAPVAIYVSRRWIGVQMYAFAPKTGVVGGYSADTGAAHRHHIQCIITYRGVIGAVITNGICGIQFAAILLPLKRVSNSVYSTPSHGGALDRVIEHCH